MVDFGYLVIGCPGSGKSWVCEQLREHFHYIPRAKLGSAHYLLLIDHEAKAATKPLLLEAPFSVSEIMAPLARAGFRITTVYIQEAPDVIAPRYQAREGRPIPPGHLTRQATFLQRSRSSGAFHGTAAEVLAHLLSQHTCSGSPLPRI